MKSGDALIFADGLGLIDSIELISFTIVTSVYGIMDAFTL